MVPIILSHNPAGSSTQTLFHFAQGYTSGETKNDSMLLTFDNYKLLTKQILTEIVKSNPWGQVHRKREMLELKRAKIISCLVLL